MAQRVAGVAVVLLVGAAVVLWAAAPRLGWFVLAGVVLAVAYWFPRPALVVLPLVVAAAVIGLALSRTTPGPPIRPLIPESQDVRLLVQARYDTGREGWAVDETLAVRDEALAAAAAVLRPEAVDATGRSGLPRDAQVDALATWLAGQGWARGQERGAEPVFLRDGFVPAEVRVVPLRTRLSLAVRPVEVGGFVLFLTAGEGSVAELVAPAGLVVSTEPPSEAATVPDGELRTVELYRAGASRYTIAVEAASPLARYEPLRSLPDIARGDVPGYLLAGALALGLGVFKERALALVQRLLDRRRPSDGPATPG